MDLPTISRTRERQRARSGSQRTQHSDQGKTARDGRDARWHPVRPWRAVLFVGNHFYIGEVKYKNEILPGEQPPIMDRALFDAARQKSLARWSHRTIVRNKSDHLLTGLLLDDAGHRMVPTHATKAGVRYRYYVSTPFLHGEAKTASAGSVSRIPAADIEDVVVKFLKEYLTAKQEKSTISAVHLGDRGDT